MATALIGCGARASEPFRLTKLADDSAGGGDGAVSPDGQSFVISSRRTGDWNLWSYSRDTTKWSQLTSGHADDFEAQWSPDDGASRLRRRAAAARTSGS